MKMICMLLIMIVSFNLFGYYSNDKKLEFKNYLKNKNLTELENLIKANGSPDFLFDDEEISPLQYAVHVEDVNLIKLLLRYNANINFRGYDKDPLPSPIFMSIDKGNIEIFKIFAESKSFNKDSQENDCTLLLAALNGKQVKIAKFLIEKGADVKKCGNKRTGCPLHLTAVLGLNDIMIEIISKGVDINDEFNEFTPLMYALINGQIEAAAVLLKNGADPYKTFNKENHDIRKLVGNSSDELVKKFVNSIFEYKVCPILTSYFEKVNKDESDYRPVRLLDKKTLGIIDNNGRITAKVQANRISYPSNGIVWFENTEPGKYTKKYGFMSVAGKIISKPVYDDVTEFINEFAWVKKDGRWALIDKNGKVLTQFVFDEPVAITKDFKLGRIGSLLKLVDKENRVLDIKIPEGYELVTPKNYPEVNNGNYLVKKEDHYILTAPSGDKIFENNGECSLLFEGGSGRFKKNYEHGLFSEEGKIITQFYLESMDEKANNGFFTVSRRLYSMKTQKAFLDSCGNILGSEWFDDVKEFTKRGKAISKKGDLWGIIEYTGKKIGQPVYEKIDYINLSLSNDLIAVKKDGRWGFINSEGEEKIPFSFNDAASFKNGRATVLEGNQWWVIDESGKKIFKVSGKGYFQCNLLFDEGSVYNKSGKSLPYIPYYNETIEFGGF